VVKRDRGGEGKNGKSLGSKRSRGTRVKEKLKRPPGGEMGKCLLGMNPDSKGERKRISDVRKEGRILAETGVCSRKTTKKQEALTMVATQG